MVPTDKMDDPRLAVNSRKKGKFPEEKETQKLGNEKNKLHQNNTNRRAQ